MLAKEEKGIFERETGKLYFEENAGLNARAWQTGILSFRNTPMREVARSLEHYFQVHLDFERAEMKSCSFTFDTLHREDLPILVETVETIFEADVRQLDGRHYLLTGGSCHPD